MSDIEWRGLTLAHLSGKEWLPGDSWRFGEEDLAHVFVYSRDGDEADRRGKFHASFIWLRDDSQYFPSGDGDGSTAHEALDRAFEDAVPRAKKYADALRRMGVEP